MRDFDLKQAVINSDLGRDCGDAFGVPFERMSRQDILNATGGEGVTRPRFDFDPKSRRVPDTRGLPKGATSDDTQLGRAVERGLIMSGRYDHELLTLLHLEALWNDAAGWGGTTKRSLYEIDQHYRSHCRRLPRRPPSFKKEKDAKLWHDAAPRDPRMPAAGGDKKRGNGPSMKISPLGLYYGLRGGGDFESGEAFETILQLSRLTHPDAVCAAAACAVAGVCSDLLSDGVDAARGRLLPRLLRFESEYRFLHAGPDRFSSALSDALALIGDPEALWAFGSAGDSDTMTTVPLALAIWWRHSGDQEPTAAVLEAINAGGDTDTVGAMVGAMMGALSDQPNWWPHAWSEALCDRGANAKLLGSQLYEVGTLRKLPIADADVLTELKRKLGYL